MSSILVLHGPNLNLLGNREPDKYGSDTLAAIESRLVAQAKKNRYALVSVQSNAEAELVDAIQAASGQHDFIIINPAALTHTSIAIRDALLSVQVPCIEVHLSNIHARENFRHTSYISDIAIGVITGLGSLGYDLALQAAINYLQSSGPGSRK